MITLDAINDMLASRGIRPVSSLDDSRSVATATQKLENVRKNILSVGWWFNTESVTLTPDSTDSKIYLPYDYLGVRGAERTGVAQRGRLLYDTENGTSLFTATVKCVCVRDIIFEEVPEMVAAYIAGSATLSYQRDYDGDSTKTRQLESEVAALRTQARAEHIRNTKFNSLDNNPLLYLVRRHRSR